MPKGPAQKIQDVAISLLTERRKELGLSHEKLASLAGVHRTAISHIENRKRNPTLQNCIKIAQALDVPLSKIIEKAEKNSQRK
jgi:transcriptional regulator with XRE-family HTH domain